MKKILILACLVLLLTGCRNQDNVVIGHNVDSSYFHISSDFERAKVGFYVPNNRGNRLDTKEVELGLMRISSNHFNNNNTYWQSGQHLSRPVLREMITAVNRQPIEIEGESHTLPVVSYIYEANLVNSSNNLRGIALAININRHQTIGRSSIELTDEQIIKFINDNFEEIAKPLRNIDGLEDVRLAVGVFGMNPNTSILPGVYIAEGTTTNNEISLNSLNNRVVLFSGNTRANTTEHQDFTNLDQMLRGKYPNIMINAIATYTDDQMTSLEITINIGAVAISNLMSVGQDIINNINSNFRNKQNIKVLIRNNNQDTAFIIFNDQNRNGSIHLLP